MTDLSAIEIRTLAADDTLIPAGKVHVLGLTRLKDRLSGKWPRLSNLVHRLIEVAFERIPADHCLRLDELSYAVIFRNLSVEEAELACVSVANDICRTLFGDQVAEVAVRIVLAEVPAENGAACASVLEQEIEARGRETVIAQGAGFASPRRIAASPGRSLPPADTIEGLRDMLDLLSLRFAFVPIWDLRKGTSQTLLATPFRGTVAGAPTRGGDESRLSVELEALRAAAAYAERMAAADRICSIGTAVSYDTLSGINSRVRFITALKKARPRRATPLLLRIAQIPDGAPMGRIAEFVTMLRMPHVHIALEFANLRTMPRFDVRIGASGIGGVVLPELAPETVDVGLARAIVQNVVRLAKSQRAFVFLDRLDTAELLDIALDANIRFGAGTALGTQRFAGHQALPVMPLEWGLAGAQPRSAVYL